GGGGLLAGVSHAVRLALGQGVDVVGVQARGAAAYPESLSRGTPVPLSTMTTMADGIAVGRPGDVPLEVVRREVRRIDLVSEEEMSQALLLLAERAKLVVEPSGAVGVAGAIAGAGTWQEGPVAIVLTGGSIRPPAARRARRSPRAHAGAASRHDERRALPHRPCARAGPAGQPRRAPRPPRRHRRERGDRTPLTHLADARRKRGGHRRRNGNSGRRPPRTGRG